jgi:hypothetical protein
VKRRFESKWANRAAQAGITVAAVAFFLLIRPGIYAHPRDTVQGNYQQKILSPKIIAEYLHTTPKPKIQIGAGPSNAAGWLDSDIEPTLGQAYLDVDDTGGFFKEAHPVLARGGKLRMVAPNLNQFIVLFNGPDVEHPSKTSHYIARTLDSRKNWDKTIHAACLILNNEIRAFGDRFLYTPALLRESYLQAGFRESSDPTFATVELRPRGEWKDVNAFEAMAIEATR